MLQGFKSSTEIVVKHIESTDAKQNAKCKQSTSMFCYHCFNLINRQQIFLPFTNGGSVVPVLIQ